MGALLLELRSASGYVAVFLLPALLAAATGFDEPYLVFGTVMLVFPLTRMVFGAVAPSPALEWRPWLTRLVCNLQAAYASSLAMSLGYMLLCWANADTAMYDAAALGWVLSLWMTLVFATCAAHALLHARGPRQRLLGHALAGVAGYPILGYEHVRHHRLTGSTEAAECPRLNESVWTFAARRLMFIARESLAWEGVLRRGDPDSPAVRGMRLAVGIMATAAGLFTAAAGWAGLGVYLGAALLVAFAIQLVTYMQHWGLGDDQFADARNKGYSWDSDCQFQAWITFGLSLHQAHHDAGAEPFFRCHLAEGSPRHPAGYVLLMLAALIPTIWKRVMTPVLRDWIAAPHKQLTAGRRLTCISAY